MDVKAFVDGVGKLQGKLEPVVGDEGGGAPPQELELVDEKVDGADGGKLGCCHCVHAGWAAAAVGDEEDAGVSAWSKGQRAEVVDADLSRGRGRVGQRMIWSEVLRAWYLR